VGAVRAADSPDATLAYRPGDVVRVFVTFKEPVTLTGGSFRFDLQGAQPDGQKVLQRTAFSSTFTKLSDTEYELDAKISEDLAEGTYQLSWIQGAITPALSRMFDTGTGLPLITVRLRNERRISFPDIKEVRIGAPERR
jgi:hypothetical protein